MTVSLLVRATILNPAGVNYFIFRVPLLLPCTDVEGWNTVIIECGLLAANWERLSGYLGLSFEILDDIKKCHPNNNSDCWNEALKQWIKQNYKTEMFGEPSWRTLLRAIAKVDKLRFKKLAERHQLQGDCQRVI